MNQAAVEDETCRAFDRIDGRGPGQLLRFIVGEDDAPRPMSPEEMAQELGDPFATLLLASGTFPVTADEVLTAIDAATPEGDPLKKQRSFVLGEGSQLLLGADDVESTNRGIRFLVARGAAPHGPELVISASHPDQGLVELMAWDVKHRGFNYYRTLRGEGGWVWAGNSRHALTPPTRGKGPFESHPSGNLIMKELKFPWLHWHSSAVSISENVFEVGDIRRDHAWFRDKEGAQICETAVVMPSIRRWTAARFEQIASGTNAIDLPRLIEHIVTCPTVNLATSSNESATARLGSPVTLPPTFVADAEALDAVGLEGPPGLSVPADVYLSSLEKFEFRLTVGDFSQPGDTHFAFVVPERAFEDHEVLRQALAGGVIAARLAACLLMVDFPNPVFSGRRARLLQHVPSAVGTSDISEAIAHSIIEASEQTPQGSPERDFTTRWAIGENGWKDAFNRELVAYYDVVQARVGSQEGFDDYIRLAEARRNEFRKLPLFESPLLFPETNLPREHLMMTAQGAVVEAAT